MLKNILNLKGTHSLNKEEQSNITGGYDYQPCSSCSQCPAGRFCNGSHCVPCKYDPNQACCFTIGG